MNGERWQEIEALFQQAAELTAPQRRPFLDRACNGDDELRRQVESLLAADGAADGFLEQPALEALDAPPTDGAETASAGRSVGPYKLLRQLGEGGMGTVYLAVRADDEYRQEVALKIFAWGRERRDLVRRFRTERQILASLQHPSIASLLDGGTTEDGLPYLVMEQIEGEPIDRYCDRQRLTVGERIELFRTLCAAVQYAHRALVVHRDIKPSNVLVNGDGVPKLLDFGIAKLVDPEGFPETVERTVTGQRLMTPRYASPEQVRGEAVTTASDVYSLGVLLYELFTGTSPYRVGCRRTRVLERAVLGEEPERPSAAVGRAGVEGEAAPETRCRARGTRPERLRRHLAGDLDNIVLKALRKEPERRYGSVEQLAEDLRRYQQGLPVLARRPTFAYRSGKFLQRHRFGALAAAAFVVLGLAFGANLSIERDQARRERDKAQAVATFLEEIFQGSDPGKARGEAVTAREILDRGAERIDRELADQPGVHSALCRSIGNVYHSLGLYEQADSLLRRSLDLRLQIHREGDHPEVVESLYDLALLRRSQSDLDGAETLLRRVLEARRRSPDRTGDVLAPVLADLGLVLGMKSQYGDAEPLLREALALRRQLYEDRHPEVAESLNDLGRVLRETGELDDAEEIYRQALSIRRQSFGELHPDVVASTTDLAEVLHRKGELDGAETLYRESLDIARRLYGGDHPDVVEVLGNLAVVYGMRGDYETAEPIFREVVEMNRRLLGDRHRRVARSLNNLGRLLREKGDLAAAEEIYGQSLELYRQALGDQHPEVASQVYNLAWVLADRGDPRAAERLFRQALEIHRRKVGEEHHDVGLTLIGLGAARLAGGDPVSAEPLLRRGLDVLRRTLPEHWQTAVSASHLGACLTALRRFDEAEALLVSSYDTLVEKRGPEHRGTVAARQLLIELYDAWDRPREAARYRAAVP